MATRGVNSTLRRLLAERRLTKTKLSEEAIERELEGAAYDLVRAKSSLTDHDFKVGDCKRLLFDVPRSESIAVQRWLS